MDENYFVYMHISPNGKRYIGITQNYLKRWRNGLGYKKNSYFYSAIQKYGWDKFKHIIIAENLTLHDAEKMEVELIAEYKTNQKEFGYNHAEGGKVNRGYKLSQETRKKLSESHIGIPNSNKGKLMSKKQKEKISQALKDKHSGENHHFYGKHHSDETKYKISESNKGKSKNVGKNNCWFGKNLSEAHKNKISESLSGRTLSSQHKQHLSESLKGKPPTKTSRIVQYSLNNDFIQSFNSIVEAEEITGISRYAISHAVRGNTKANISNGFIWKYDSSIKSINKEVI